MHSDVCIKNTGTSQSLYAWCSREIRGSKHLNLKKTSFWSSLKYMSGWQRWCSTEAVLKGCLCIWKWISCRNGSINAWLMMVCIRCTHKIRACGAGLQRLVWHCFSAQPVLGWACCRSVTPKPLLEAALELHPSGALLPQTEWHRRGGPGGSAGCWVTIGTAS